MKDGIYFYGDDHHFNQHRHPIKTRSDYFAYSAYCKKFYTTSITTVINKCPATQFYRNMVVNTYHESLLRTTC